MFKRALILYLVCLASLAAQAQKGFILKGRIFEYNTHVELPDIHVTNLSTKNMEVSDAHGHFAIDVKLGDRLTFTGGVYQPDTLVVTDEREKELQLIPKVNLLKQVDVKNTVAPGMAGGYYDPQFHGQTVTYARDANLDYKGGIDIKLSYWNKDANKKKRDGELAKQDQVQDQIAAIFTAANIAKYVPLKGKELDDFIVLYRPTPKVFTAHDFVLTAYLNDSYKLFLSLPEDKRHPEALTAPLTTP